MNEFHHIQYIKTVLTKGSCKLSLGLESTHRHEKYTLHANIMSHQVFARSYSSKGERPSVTTLSSRKSHSALPEIVSLVNCILQLIQHYITGEKLTEVDILFYQMLQKCISTLIIHYLVWH